jgi:hypothetical protein
MFRKPAWTVAVIQRSGTLGCVANSRVGMNLFRFFRVSGLGRKTEGDADESYLLVDIALL